MVGKKIIAGFDGGRLTSDAGRLLLREADRGLGLTGSLAECIADGRDPAKITHDLRTLLAQRVFGIALGYKDLNDHTTLCRFEHATTRGSLCRMSGVFVEQFVASHQRPPKELVLDFDPTDDSVHGNQEGRFFHDYYEGFCFLPLYVFCGDPLLCSYLRPSNIDGAKHARAIEHWHRSLELEPAQPRIRKLIDRYKPQRTNPEAALLDHRPQP